MTISHIHAFIAIVENGSFSEAAAALYTTQATVSKHIRSLEKELQYELFDRSHRKPQLTHAGQVFYKYALEFAGLHTNLKRDLLLLCGNDAPCISIVSIPVMAQYGICTLIREFTQKHPYVRIRIEEMETSDLLPALESRQVSLAFCRLLRPDEIDCERIDMLRERTFAVLPEDHPLAKNSRISLSDLKNESFILPNKQTGLYDFYISLCIEHGGFFPEVSYAGNRADTIGDMVAQRMGISLFPELGAKFLLAQHHVACVPLDADAESVVSLVRPRGLNPSPGGDLFWRFIQNRYHDSLSAPARKETHPAPPN